MHTSGPWTAMVTDTMGDTPALWDIVQRSSGGTVAEIQSHNSGDAALVAAAPDLLAALNALLNLSVKGHALADRLQFSDSGRAILNQARAAIARATGGQ